MWGSFFIQEAFALDDVSGARRAAMGGAGVAAHADNSAITLNPALLGLIDRFDFDLQGTGGTERLLGVGASAVDAHTGPIAFGVTWQYTRDEPELAVADLPGWIESGVEVANVRRDHLVVAGLSLPLLERRLAFGLGGGLALYQNDLGGSGRIGDLDAGVAGVPTPGLVLGASARDLIPLNDEMDAPPSFLLGGEASGDVGALTVEGGLRLDAASPAALVGGGGELRVDVVRLRVGGRFDTHTGAAATWGLGVESPTGALEYAMSLPLGGGPWVHAIGLRFSTVTEDLPF